MSPKARYRIGCWVFVSLSLAFFAGFLLWLWPSLRAPEVVEYTIEFREDVSGISPSSRVTWEGTLIGRVSRAPFLQAGSQHPRVPMAIEKRYAHLITTWTRFQLQANLVTGIQAIYAFRKDLSTPKTPSAEPSPPESPCLPAADGPPLDLPFEQTEFSTGEQLRRELIQTKEMAIELIDFIKTRLSQTIDVAKESMTKAGQNMDLVGTTFKSTAEETQNVLRQGGDILEANQASLKRSLDNLAAMLGPDAPLAKTLGNMDRLTGEKGEVTRTLASVQQALAATQDSLEAVNRTLASQEAGIAETAFQLRYAVVELRQLLDVLNRDPSQLLWGRTPSPGGPSGPERPAAGTRPR
ncbi:MAG: MCE family protein [Planctomycetes bacterium]|nr:MCE family protein [Planctomycetota bacterium]